MVMPTLGLARRQLKEGTTFAIGYRMDKALTRAQFSWQLHMKCLSLVCLRGSFHQNFLTTMLQNNIIS